MKEFLKEFLDQFFIESREHVEQATADLLALEKAPSDDGRLDSAFRSFHTLKGGAQIIDFDAMARAVHAAEGVLSALRSGEQAISAAVIGDCLACLDQVVQWLDAIEAAGGELPQDAEAGADRIVARFARTEGDSAPPQAGSAASGWVSALLARHPGLRNKAGTAIRYRPDPNCFYEGVDPVALVAGLPGLLSLDLEPASPWPPLDELDPFVSNLVLLALSASPSVEVIGVLGDAAEQCEVRSLGSNEAVAGSAGHLTHLAREILEAQVALLRETGGAGALGRMASAGNVAANVMRSAKRDEEAAALSRASGMSLSQGDPGLLREAIEALLGGPQAQPDTGVPAAASPESAARTLRIDAARLDALVNLTGELAVAKNAIGHAVKLAQAGDASLPAVLKSRHAVLERLVAELQRSVLAMRVLPLNAVFRRFPRLVREISGNVGKSVNLVIEGGATEADKAIVEMLFEPLLHVLRNAVDHGIEDAAARAASRKPPTATVRLRGGRQGEHVTVDVIDDGRGIDVARIREVARERGIAQDEDLAAMSDAQAVDMIFEPGFSTASEVTGLSGRGVGMDAVRTAVERMAGRVEIDSRAGEGTTVRFTLPFSVMMTRVMVVYAGGQTFGIPLDAVAETLRVGTGQITPVGAAQAIVLRERTVPLVPLADALGLTAGEDPSTEATIVVTRIDGQYGALRVDRIGERMEVMLKPLDGLLAGMRGVAGSTLLGDGSVLLVLDLEELF